jgi:arylsulfatase A
MKTIALASPRPIISNRKSMKTDTQPLRHPLALLVCTSTFFLANTNAGADETKPSAATPAPARVVAQAEDGSVLLHARDVTVHGTTVRYEPQPHKNTIGFWTKVDDWVSWDFEITHPGRFAVEILQGCGNGSGGSDVEFSVGDQTLKITVEETGGFQNFAERNIGAFNLDKPGKYTLSVKPKTKPHAAVMDLRQVVLKPQLK